MSTDLQDVSGAYEVCRRITYQHAKTFYFASFFIPKHKRQACYAVYAFCRYVDDIVDVAMESGDVTREGAIALVNQWRADVDMLYDGTLQLEAVNAESSAVLTAWEDTLTRYRIPRHLPEELIAGVLMDTTLSRFQTYEELRNYSYHVASTVGLMTSEIFGYSSDDALPHAIDLGIAMQITNIIRDVNEDAERGRIYLPHEDMAAYGVSEDDILAHASTPAFRSLIRHYVQTADALYNSADVGIGYLHEDSQLTVQLMSMNYRKILRHVERMDYDVFRGRASTSLWEKVASVPAAYRRVIRNRRSRRSL